MTNFEMVREFHEKFGCPVREKPTANLDIPSEEISLRMRLMGEELAEYSEAVRSWDIVGIADGLADLLYAVYGTALSHGIDIDLVFAVVHRSNMTKTALDGRGKTLKGTEYEPPVLEPTPGVRS